MLLPAGLNTNFHKLMDAAEGLLHRAFAAGESHILGAKSLFTG